MNDFQEPTLDAKGLVVQPSDIYDQVIRLRSVLSETQEQLKQMRRTFMLVFLLGAFVMLLSIGATVYAVKSASSEAEKAHFSVATLKALERSMLQSANASAADAMHRKIYNETRSKSKAGER
jgi:hypothetical protein